MQTILLTGGAGFIGSHIADYLINKNHKVIILDNLSTGNKKNIEHLLNNPNLIFIEGDISDINVVRNSCRGVDIICNQAALGSVPRSIDNPLNSHISNVNGFLNILIVAKELGIKRVVYASSSSVYGNSEELPKVENNIGTQMSPYAITKYINELYANIFTSLYGLECIGLRYFNVFGPRQNPNGEYVAVIPKFIESLKNNIAPIINGDGSYSRDFTYVDNVVQANYLAMTSNNDYAFGEVFNVGTNSRITILHLYECIAKYMKSEIKPIFGTIRKGDMKHSNADISKTQKLLNYNPDIKFYEGLNKTLDYLTSGL